MSGSSSDTFSSTQLAEMQNDLSDANSAFASGDYQDAKNDISSYYQVQFGMDAYSTMANDVVLDQGVYGETPDQELSNAGISYGGSQSVNLMLNLAQNNLTDIQADGDQPATESQIEQEHLVSFRAVSISISDWGATPMANAGINWLQGATARELSDTINTNFQSLSDSSVTESEALLLVAGMEITLPQEFADAAEVQNGVNPDDEAFQQQAGESIDDLINLTGSQLSSGISIFLSGLKEIGSWAENAANNVENKADDIINNIGIGIGYLSDFVSGTTPTVIGPASSLNIIGSVSTDGISLTDSASGSNLILDTSDDTDYVGSLENQIIVATGDSDTIAAGSPLEMLYLSGGGGGTLEAGTYSNILEIASPQDSTGNIIFSGESATNVTEIALSPTTSIGGEVADGLVSTSDQETNASSNTFFSGAGTNVLIGDLGNNTFVENPTATSAVNIIWGGGGTSTYDLAGGVVDIIYTSGTVNAQDIESLSLKNLEQMFQSSELPFGWPDEDLSYSDVVDGMQSITTYIIDPSPNDVVVTSSDNSLVYWSSSQTISGQYTPQNGNGYYNAAFTVGATAPSYGEVDFGFNTQHGAVNPALVINNFQNTNLTVNGNTYGNLNISFSGDFTTPSGSDTNSGPGGYSSCQAKTINLGSSTGADGNNNKVTSGGSEYFMAAAPASGIEVESGGSATVLSGGETENATIYGGGVEVVSSGGLDYNSIIESGGIETDRVGAAISGSIIESGGYQFILPGGSAVAVTVSSGGYMIVAPGGDVTGTVVDPGGSVISTGIVVSQSTGFTLSSGTVSGAVLYQGETEYILPGGIAEASVLSGGQIYVLSGGAVSATIADSGGSLFVSAGGLASASTVNSGGAVYVYSGGLDSGSQLTYAGSETVLSGGQAFGDLISGGNLFVSSGGLANRAVNSYGNIDVYSGGLLSNSDIAGGNAYISGGIDSASLIVSGGSEDLVSGGSAYGVSVSSGGEEWVLSGGAAYNANVGNQGQLYVLSEGVISGGGITSGGYGEISSGGIAFGLDIENQGQLVVLSGGVLSGGNVGSGAYEIIMPGATAEDVTVDNDGYLIALPGGTANVISGNVISTGLLISGGAGFSYYPSNYSSTAGIPAISANESEYVLPQSPGGQSVISGGTQYVLSGATTSGTVLDDGGTEYISAGGIAIGTTGSSGSGSQTVLSGGVASNTTLGDGGIQAQYILSGGFAVDDMVSSSGGDYVSGGIASNTTIASGGAEYVYSGGMSFDAMVSGGGAENVEAGGANISATISAGSIETVFGATSDGVVGSGGIEFVSSGGFSSDSTILSGGAEIIFSGGNAVGVTVNSGGELIILNGGLATNVLASSGEEGSGDVLIVQGGSASLHSGTVSNLTGYYTSEYVFSGGAVSGGELLSGGLQYVYSGGEADQITIGVGVRQIVFEGGIVSSSTIVGTQILSGGTSSDTKVLLGQQSVYSGGLALNTIVDHDGSQHVYAGGGASGTVLGEDGWNDYQAVSSGGAAWDTAVYYNGEQEVATGGIAYQTTINSGGILRVSGTASGTEISAGGRAYISGTSDSATISSGGVEYVSGGSSYGDIVANGGTENVVSGVASGTVIYSGGVELVYSGGVAANTVIEGGGTETLQSGATARGSIDFAGSNGTLSIGDTTLPGAVISGFDLGGSTGDEIVLSSYTYSSSDSVTLGPDNLLSLDIGGTIATLQLDSSADYSGHSFYLSSDVSGDLVVLDPLEHWTPSVPLFLSTTAGIGHSLNQPDTLSPLQWFRHNFDHDLLSEGLIHDMGQASQEAMLGTPQTQTFSSYAAFSSTPLVTSGHVSGGFGLSGHHPSTA